MATNDLHALESDLFFDIITCYSTNKYLDLLGVYRKLSLPDTFAIFVLFIGRHTLNPSAHFTADIFICDEILPFTASFHGPWADFVST